MGIREKALTLICGEMDVYWRETLVASITLLCIWAWFALVTPALAEPLNGMVALGFPIGFYMCAQGSLIVFVILNFVWSRWKDKIDDRAGYKEPVEEAGNDYFMKNLSRIYCTYTGGFFTFVLFLALLNEVAGVSDEIVGYLFVALTILVYAAIGILSRTQDAGEYYVAGRNVPSVYNGMATAADWMSGASFVGLAGTVYAGGFSGLAYIIGWTGGYCLLGILIAPFLRKLGAYTVPDYYAVRFPGFLKIGDFTINLGNITRGLAILVLLFATFTYLTAQAYSIGIIMSRFLGIDFELSVYVGLAGILFCSLLGGMRAVTWTQVAQYIVLIIAYLIPATWMSAARYSSPIPQLSYGLALESVEELEGTLYQNNFTSIPPENFKFFTAVGNTFDFFALSISLMIGTASLPHVLMRYLTTPSVRKARSSVSWSLLFIFFLYVTAPAYATLTRLEVLENVIGSPLADLPQWVYIFGKIGLVKICGQSSTSLEAVMAACQTDNNQTILKYEQLVINNDAVVLAAPEISGQPYVISGLLSAGGLAAALSTADGLLLAIANSLSHDIYFSMVDKNASEARRMFVSRVMLVACAILAAYVASTKPADILGMVAWAFSMAASGNFPALLLGIWWKRCNTYGAIAGILAGFVTTLVYVFGTRYGGMPLWFQGNGYAGLQNAAIGVFTVPLGAVVMIVVSLLTPPPATEIQNIVERLRHFEEKELMNHSDEAKPEFPARVASSGEQNEVKDKGIGMGPSMSSSSPSGVAMA